MKTTLTFDTKNLKETGQAFRTISTLYASICPKQVRKQLRKADLSNKDLTKKEILFLTYWTEHLKTFGIYPTIAQATREMGYRSPNSIRQFIDSLRAKKILIYQLEGGEKNGI